MQSYYSAAKVKKSDGGDADGICAFYYLLESMKLSPQLFTCLLYQALNGQLSCKQIQKSLILQTLEGLRIFHIGSSDLIELLTAPTSCSHLQRSTEIVI